MLESVLAEMRNWFEAESHAGEFAVVGGSLPLDVQEGQYYRIRGSVFNDGLHQSGDVLQDEVFEGCVDLLAVPAAVVSLAEDISAWAKENGAQTRSPYASESFKGYSYTVNADASDWKRAFSDELSRWRKL